MTITRRLLSWVLASFCVAVVWFPVAAEAASMVPA